MGGQEHVVAPGLVQQRRAWRAAGEHVGNRWQLLEIDLDALGDVLGLGTAGGDAHRHRLADMAHAIHGQRMLRGRLEAGQAFGHEVELACSVNGRGPIAARPDHDGARLKGSH